MSHGAVVASSRRIVEAVLRFLLVLLVGLKLHTPKSKNRDPNM